MRKVTKNVRENGPSWAETAAVFLCLDLLKRERPPKLQGAVRTAGEKRIPMLGKGDRPNPFGMPFQNGYFLVNVRMPQTDRVIHAGAGESAAIGGKDELVHWTSMSCEVTPWLMSAEVPKGNRARLFHDSQQLPVWRKRQVTNKAHFPRAADHELVGGDVPNAHPPFGASGGESLAVAGDCQGLHGNSSLHSAEAGNHPPAGHIGKPNPGAKTATADQGGPTQGVSDVGHLVAVELDRFSHRPQGDRIEEGNPAFVASHRQLSAIR
jgi:hypothetical protein